MSRQDRSSALSLGLRLIWRQLTSQPAVVLSIVVAVVLGAFLITAVPRMFEHVAADDLEATVSVPPPAQRNIRVEVQGRIPAGPEGDELSVIKTRGEQFSEQAMPVSVATVIDDSYFVMDTPQFAIAPMPGEDPPHPFPMFLRYRYQEDIEGQMTLVEGVLPQPQEPIAMLIGPQCPEDREPRDELFARLEAGEEVLGQDGEPIVCAIEEVPHFQIAVTDETLEDLGIELGRQMLLRPDPTDRLYFGLSAADIDFHVVMSISGIIELSDVREEYWYGDPNLHRPRVQENADLRIIFATGLMRPEDYRPMVRTFGFVDRLYTYRHFVDPELVGEADLDVLTKDLRTFAQTYSVIAAMPGNPRVLTQLPDLLDNHVEQRTQTLAMMSTGLAGLFSAVVGVVLVLAVLMTERQRQSIVLTRGRGASGGQLSLSKLYQALILVVPATVLAYLAAAWALPDTGYLFPYRASVALAAGTTVAIVLATVPLARRRLGELLQDRRSAPASGSARRIVFDVMVLSLALGSIVLLRRRGQADQPAPIGFDWLAAFAPTLIAVAAGLITIRLYPVLVRLLAWIGSKAKGLVGFVGFRRILQQHLAARLPVLSIVLCIGVASYAVVAGTTVRNGQENSSWQAVGADYLLTGNGPNANLAATLDMGALPVESHAEAATFASARLEVEVGEVTAQAMAIDADAFNAVTDGTPGAANLPGRLLEGPTPNVGLPERPIPVIVSSVWPRGVRFSRGDTFTVDLGRLTPTMVVVEIRERFPSLEIGRPFVVFDLEAIRTFSDLPVTTTRAYLRGPESAGAPIQATIDDVAQGTRYASRHETLAALTDDPFVAWVSTGLTVVFWFSVALATVAAVSSLAIASSTRRRDFAYLRTMGLTTRQATAMTVIEQFPAVVIATVVGALVGVGSATALDPAIDFDAFTGNLVPTALTVSWAVIVAGSLALITALAAGVVIFVLVSRDAELGETLKVGDE